MSSNTVADVTKRRGLTRRAWLVGASAGIGAFVGRFLSPTSDSGPSFPPTDTDGGINSTTVLNDASELSPTPVASHVTITDDRRAAVLERIRTAIAQARASGRSLVASTARHSMGGQSLARNGTVVTLDQAWLEPDITGKVYRVAAGTCWSVVIKKLDAIGFSPAVMQSNNDFGVASTFSVNAHGWPVPFSGCGSTVRAITMLLSDGTAVRCSRTENADHHLARVYEIGEARRCDEVLVQDVGAKRIAIIEGDDRFVHQAVTSGGSNELGPCD